MSQNLPYKTPDELLRESINMLPRNTQMIIKAYATKLSIDDETSHPVLWLSVALSWWNDMRDRFAKVGISEEEASAWLIAELKKQELWNRLFSEDPLSKEN